MASQRCVIGVDLGGTNVRAQALFADGTEAGPRFENPSNAQSGVEATLDSLISTIRQAEASAVQKPEAVGLAIPGHVDDRTGIVRWAPNFGKTIDGVFHYWEDIPVGVPVGAKIDMPIHMGNDANCAALGEYMYGTGRGNAKCLVMITLGTGIGGGVVMSPDSVLGDARGRLVLVGGNMGGAELGHTIIQQGGLDCPAGTYGAVEAYCQRDAIVRRAQHKLRRGLKSSIRELVEGDLSKITPRIISEAADGGDALAQEVWREIGMYLGTAVGSLINVFAPDIFPIGGQVSKAGKWLFEPMIAEAGNVAIRSLFRDATILPAEQVEDAGLLGAGALALELTR